MEEKKGSLADLTTGQWARICQVRVSGDLGGRLEDLGLIPGTWVLCRIGGSRRSLGAYEARGTVLALRGRDARGILVERET